MDATASDLRGLISDQFTLETGGWIAQAISGPQPCSARPDARSDLRWSAGFLPSHFQRVEFRSKGDPVLSMQNPDGASHQQQCEATDAITQIIQLHVQAVGDRKIATRIAQFEMAFRLLASAPELSDFSDQLRDVLDLECVSDQDGSLTSNCLLARRLRKTNGGT